MKKWTEREIEELVSSLGDEVLGDDEAFDIADGILVTEQGLKESIERVYGVPDALGWLANKV